MFIWTDIETTGLDPARDEVLALGLLITDDKFNDVASREWIIHVPAGFRAMRDMSDYVREMHERNGLLQRVADSQLDVRAVEREACAFLDEHLGPPAQQIRERPPMAGNSVHTDRSFLAHHCPALISRFNYRHLDVTSFRLLALAETPSAQLWIDAQPDVEHMPLADIAASRREFAHWRRILRAA